MVRRRHGERRGLPLKIMFDLLRLFPRRPLAISIAGWTYFFVVQIAFLSVAAWKRYSPPPEPTYLDQMWFVYTELPRAIPMATVYAVCMVFVAQMIGWFVSRHNPDNLDMGQWYQLLKTSPIWAITWMSFRVISVLAMAGLVLSFVVPFPSWLSRPLAILLVMLFYPLMFNPWLKWFVQGMMSRNESEGHQDEH